MSKTTAGPKLVRIQASGAGVRGRDAEFPSVPFHVSGNAQARPLDMNTVRQFSFSQLDRSTLPERPSTSSGPAAAANFSMRRNAEKRETKDDLYFGASHEKANTFYDFPLPGSLPTPTGSLRNSTSPPRQSSGPRSFTPESIEAGQNTGMHATQMEIGMAIGSPTHQPAAWQPHTFQQVRSPSPDTLQESVDDRVPPTPAKQKSKWKMFGGLFGGSKKQSPTPVQQNFYQLQAEVAQTEKQPAHIRFEEPREQLKSGRGRTKSERKIAKAKPDVKRSNTAPNRFEMNPSIGGNPEILLDGNHLDDNVIQSGNGGLMLDVDIPSVEMERYSIMFGSLLQKQPNSTLSLLARRQATLDRLKTANEELALKEQELEEKAKLRKQPRRATSPQPTRSPAFSLFPHTPSRDWRLGRTPSPNDRHTPLHRSNTSPAALSPSRPSFAPGLDNEIHATLLEPGPHIPTGYELDHSVLQISAPILDNPNTIKKKQDLRSVVKAARAAALQAPFQQTNRSFTPDQSHLTLSPNSDVYDPAPLPMKPLLVEPAWEMISQPTKPDAPESVSGSATSHSDHSTSASASSISTSTSTIPHSAYSSTQRSSAISPKAQSTFNPMKIPTYKLSQASPPQVNTTRTRTRSATTTSQSSRSLLRPTTSRRNPSEVSNSSVALSAIILPPTNLSSTNISTVTSHTQPSIFKSQTQETGSEEHEAHLKSLADVSIARQISVSRQQRQLLIPIKGSIRGKTSTANNDGRVRAATTSSAPNHQRHNQNFPTPVQILKERSPVDVGRVTSPLGAVEIATMEKCEQERERENASHSKVPGIIIKGTEKRERQEGRERECLVQDVKPSTPTLVIVGGKGEERNWDGVVSIPAVMTPKMGIAERRREARDPGNGGKRVGLFVGTGHERRGHEYRKSERVVVESLSVHSERS